MSLLRSIRRESTSCVIDLECSDVKKHERDLVENAEALAWHDRESYDMSYVGSSSRPW